MLAKYWATLSLPSVLTPEDDRSPVSTSLPEDPTGAWSLTPEPSLIPPLVQTEPCTGSKTGGERGSLRGTSCHLSTSSLVISLHNICGPMPRTSWRRKWIWTDSSASAHPECPACCCFLPLTSLPSLSPSFCNFPESSRLFKWQTWLAIHHDNLTGWEAPRDRRDCYDASP